MCGLTASLNLPYLSFCVFPSLRKPPIFGPDVRNAYFVNFTASCGWVLARQGPGVIIFSQITIKIKSKHLSGYPPLIISNMRTTNHLPDKNTHKKSFSFFVAPKFLYEKCFVIFLGRHLYLSQKVVLTLLAYF